MVLLKIHELLEKVVKKELFFRFQSTLVTRKRPVGRAPVSPALQVESLPTEPSGKPKIVKKVLLIPPRLVKDPL